MMIEEIEFEYLRNSETRAIVLLYSFEIVAAVAFATLRIQLCSEATKKM